MVKVSCGTNRDAILKKEIYRARGKALADSRLMPLTIGHTYRNTGNLTKQFTGVRRLGH